MNLTDKYLPFNSHHVKNRGMAIALALSGVLLPGLHKFYLGQRRWGIAYLLLWPTHIPQVASVIEGLWYGYLAQEEFDYNFNTVSTQHAEHRSTPIPKASEPTDSTVRSRIQTDPTYRLQSLEEVAIAAELGIEIDVNRATESDWLRLPILSDDQGRSIAALNKAGVQFHCLDDIAAAVSLPVKQLKPLEPILKFYYYDTDEVTIPVKVNPNHASIATLAKVPGITVPLALQITHHRASKPFHNVADMQKRLSLESTTVENLMHYFHFETGF